MQRRLISGMDDLKVYNDNQLSVRNTANRIIDPPINAKNPACSSKKYHAQNGPNTASVIIKIPTIADSVFFAPIVIKIKPKPTWKKPAIKAKKRSFVDILIFF